MKNVYTLFAFVVLLFLVSCASNQDMKKNQRVPERQFTEMGYSWR